VRRLQANAATSARQSDEHAGRAHLHDGVAGRNESFAEQCHLDGLLRHAEAQAVLVAARVPFQTFG
jgi:hypothetical protein